MTTGTPRAEKAVTNVLMRHDEQDMDFAMYHVPRHAGVTSMEETEVRTRRRTIRSIEWVAVVAFIFVGYISHFFITPLLIYGCYKSSTACWCVVMYVAWMYYSRDAHETGGRRSEEFRDLGWWRNLTKYFPVTIHKTAELPADRNYLLGVVPHGVLSVGAYCTFATNAHNTPTFYHGITFYLSTLKILFYLPVIRELYYMTGMVSATSRSILHTLTSGKGKAVVLVLGGAAEALYSKKGEYKIMLKKRKGFCRMAIRTGSSLVPVVSFGEVDVYDISQESGKFFTLIQRWIKSVTGIMAVKMKGTGWFGLLPKPTPIHIVVGAPIAVERKTEIMEEYVESVHETFMRSLIQLFDDNKRFYLADPHTQLQFV